MDFNTIRPNKEYKALLGQLRPAAMSYTPAYYYDVTNGDILPSSTAIGLGYITFMSCRGCKYMLVARYFMQGSVAIIRTTSNTYSTIDLSITGVPALVTLPDDVDAIGFNIKHTDMGYTPNQYTLQTPFNRQFLSTFNVFFMYPCSPHYSKLEKTLAKNKGEQFKRLSLSTDLAFYGRDYDTIASWDNRSIGALAMLETIHDGDSGFNNLAICAKFYAAECTIDKAMQSVTPSLIALDSYTDFLERYEAECNITRIGIPTVNTAFDLPPILQIYVIGSSVVTNYCGDEVWETTVDNPIDDGYEFMQKYLQSSEEDTNGQWYLVNQSNLPTATSNYVQDAEWLFINNGNDSIKGDYYFDSQLQIYVCPDNETTIDYDAQNNLATIRYMVGSTLLTDTFAAPQWPLANGYDATTSVNNIAVHSRYRWLGQQSVSPGEYTYCVFARVLVAKHIYEGMSHSPGQVRITYELNATNQFCELPPFYKYAVHKAALADNFIIQSSRQYGVEDLGYGMHDVDDNGVSHYYVRLTGAYPANSIFRYRMPLMQSEWGDTSYWLTIMQSHIVNNSIYSYKHTIKHGYTIDNTLNALMRYSGVPITINLQQNSKLLSGQVTGLQGLPIDNLVIVPATNILRGKYSQAAQVGTTTLKALLTDICERLNAGWHIDYQGLHIEGIEYYYGNESYDIPDLSQVDYDFERFTDEFNKTQFVYGQRTAKGDVSDVWSDLQLKGDAFSRYFKETQVLSQAPYSNSKSIDSAYIYDLIGCLVKPSDFSEDSLIVLACNWVPPVNDPNRPKPGYYYCKRDNIQIADYRYWQYSSSATYTVPISNASLSWARLKTRFKYNRPYGNLTFGLAVANMPSIGYLMPMFTTDIRMPISSMVHFMQETVYTCKTPLGYGIITQIKTDMITRVATMTIELYNYNLTA